MVAGGAALPIRDDPAAAIVSFPGGAFLKRAGCDRAVFWRPESLDPLAVNAPHRAARSGDADGARLSVRPAGGARRAAGMARAGAADPGCGAPSAGDCE